jgi:predicted anti-sigma-YlaC factor YlaD
MKHVSDENLSAYLDGELSEPFFRFVEAHLKDCKICEKQIIDLAQIRSLLKEGLSVEPNSYFYPKLINRLRSAKPGLLVDEIWSIARWALAGSGAIIFTLLMILMLWNGGGASTENFASQSVSDSIENRLLSKAISYDVPISNSDILSMAYETNGEEKK